jgi:hypothetical protein
MANYGDGPGLPLLDGNDLWLVGWGAMILDDGSLLLGVDGTPYGIKIKPGGGLSLSPGGSVWADEVTFLGPMRPGAEPGNGSPG